MWLAIKASLEFGVRYLGGGGSDSMASLDSYSHQTNILQRDCLEFSSEGVVLILDGKKDRRAWER